MVARWGVSGSALVLALFVVSDYFFESEAHGELEKLRSDCRVMLRASLKAGAVRGLLGEPYEAGGSQRLGTK